MTALAYPPVPAEVIESKPGKISRAWLNFFTALANVVAAGGGLKVAKHGNRALSSKSGTADVLAALGVEIAAHPDRQLKALEEAGVCFLFAQAHHGAMRHVSPIRAELGFRTLFNLLGPLSNPAWPMTASRRRRFRCTSAGRDG